VLLQFKASPVEILSIITDQVKVNKKLGSKGTERREAFLLNSQRDINQAKSRYGLTSLTQT